MSIGLLLMYVILCHCLSLPLQTIVNTWQCFHLFFNSSSKGYVVNSCLAPPLNPDNEAVSHTAICSTNFLWASWGTVMLVEKKVYIFQLKVRLFENLPPHVLWWITAKISHCALHGTMDNTMYYPWWNGIASTLPIWFLRLRSHPNGFVCARLHSVFTSTDTYFPYFASPSNDTTLLLFRIPQTLRAPCFVLTSFLLPN